MMTETQQRELGKTLWNIADKLRGSMNADDFRDYMLSFLFMRYLSYNYEESAKQELGNEYLPTNAELGKTPLQRWYEANESDVVDFEVAMRRRLHYVIKPEYLWENIVYLAKTQSSDLLGTLEKGFKYIENDSFENVFNGLFSEINLNSEKLGKRSSDRNEKLCTMYCRN